MELTQEILQAAHEAYLGEDGFKSLEKTAEWVEEEFDVSTNRFKLSDAFHANNLEVQAPNGKPQLYRGPETFADEWNELGGDWITLVWEDVRDYQRGKGYKINGISACYAVRSELYEFFIDRLQAGKERMVSADTFPPGINPDVIVEGAHEYERNMRYWVEGDGVFIG